MLEDGNHNEKLYNFMEESMKSVDNQLILERKLPLQLAIMHTYFHVCFIGCLIFLKYK